MMRRAVDPRSLPGQTSDYYFSKAGIVSGGINIITWDAVEEVIEYYKYKDHEYIPIPKPCYFNFYGKPVYVRVLVQEIKDFLASTQWDENGWGRVPLT